MTSDIMFAIGLLVAVILEGTFALFPMTLSILVVFALIKHEQFALLAAVLAGVLLDILLLRPVGVTSIIFCLLLLSLYLYDRKYEIQSFPFVLLASFASSCLYLLIFRIPHVLFQSFLAALVSSIVFIIAKRYERKKKKSHHL